MIDAGRLRNKAVFNGLGSCIQRPMKVAEGPRKLPVTENVSVSLRGFHDAFAQCYHLRIVEHIPVEGVTSERPFK